MFLSFFFTSPLNHIRLPSCKSYCSKLETEIPQAKTKAPRDIISIPDHRRKTGPRYPGKSQSPFIIILGYCRYSVLTGEVAPKSKATRKKRTNLV